MKKFHRAIIFTKTPLAGYFRYSDIFQIYPAELQNMPKSRLQEHHPVILEFWTNEENQIKASENFEEIADLYAQTATYIWEQDKIMGLLSIITNHLFFRYYDSTGMWGIPILDDNSDKAKKIKSSKWNLALFYWPQQPQQMHINDFAELEIPEVKFVDHFDYYLNNPNFDYYTGKKIETFPKTSKEILDSYYLKETEIRSIIDTAISYSVSAMELRQHKKTISLLSSFTSLETMVDLEFKDTVPEKCHSCGQLKYKVSQKYRDFLFKYIGSSESNKRKFNAYYSLRSKIVHKGKQLKTDKLFSDIPQEDKDKELLNHVEILQLGKLAIVQWLRINV